MGMDWRHVLFLLLKIEKKWWSRCGTDKGWSRKWLVQIYTMLSIQSYLGFAQIGLLCVEWTLVLFKVLKIETKWWSRCGTDKGWSTKWLVPIYTMLSTQSYLGLAQCGLLCVEWTLVLFLALKIETKWWSRCGTDKDWSTKWLVPIYTMLSTQSYLGLAQCGLLCLDWRCVLFLVLKIETKWWSRCGTDIGWTTKWLVQIVTNIYLHNLTWALPKLASCVSSSWHVRSSSVRSSSLLNDRLSCLLLVLCSTTCGWLMTSTCS